MPLKNKHWDQNENWLVEIKMKFVSLVSVPVYYIEYICILPSMQQINYKTIKFLYWFNMFEAL
jgi:hypothetical protein